MRLLLIATPIIACLIYLSVFLSVYLYVLFRFLLLVREFTVFFIDLNYLYTYFIAHDLEKFEIMI